MSASSFDRFRGEVRRWWPQLTMVAIMLVGLGAFRADSSNTDRDHEKRITRLEEVSPDVAKGLTALTVQAKATERAVERLEDKVDRLVERQ